MSAGKAQKIVRRTLMGGTLAGALALLLWASSESSSGTPLYVAAAVVLFGLCYEVARMGTIALLEPFPVLLAASVCALVFAQHSTYEGLLLARGNADLGARPPSMAAELGRAYALCFLAAAAAFALLSSGKRYLRSAPAGRLLAYAGVGASLLWAVRDVHSQPSSFWPALGALAVLALVPAALVLRGRDGWMRLLGVAAMCAWIAVPLPALWTFWASSGGLEDPALRTKSLVALIVLSKIGDTAGYYAGSAFGRSHPFKSISPGKTTEGCLASLAAAVLAAYLLQRFGVLPTGGMGVAGALAAGAAINVAAQAGDLLESWVKRRAGVKDSSRVFGPSGGLLDQVDSLLLSTPVAVLVWPILFAA